MDHTGDPANSADGEGEHGDIDHEFGDGSDIRVMSAIHGIDAADHDGKQGAETDHKTHGGEIDRFDFCQVHGIFSVFLAIVIEEPEHGFLLDEGFDDADAAIGFLGIGGKVAEQGLYVFAFFMDDGVHIIDGDGKDRQRRKNVQGQQGVFAEHKEEAEADSYQQVEEVHHGWSRIHTYPADVFRHPAHQVAGAMGLVEIGVELLIMVIDLVLLVVFDMTAHHDDRLPHEEHEKTAQQRQEQQGDAAEGHLFPKRGMRGVEGPDEFFDEDIVVGGVFSVFLSLFFGGYEIG